MGLSTPCAGRRKWAGSRHHLGRPEGGRVRTTGRPRGGVGGGGKFVSARSLHQNGVGQVLELVPEGENLLVTFDCDALDPSIMPAVIGPAPGGLTYWQAIELLDGVAKRGRIAAFDLVEFFPARDIADWARSPRGGSSRT